MSISYFQNNNGKNQKWEDITRDERYFCCELFGCIKGNEKTFVKFLKSKSDKMSEINENSEWDSGYEVCFYRDFLKMDGKSVRETDYSPKRTFDLCLFSNESIIIIEAKAQQGFKKNQLKSIADDKKRVKEIIKEIKNIDVEVKLVSLASSKYKNSEYIRSKTFEIFDCNITWEQMAEKYKTKTEIFEKANTRYNN